MRKLIKTFFTLSPAKKMKFLLFLPILIMAAIADKLVAASAIVIRFIKSRKKRFFTMLAILAMSTLNIAMFVYADQTVPFFFEQTQASAMEYVYRNCHKMTHNFVVRDNKDDAGMVRADTVNISRLVGALARYDMPGKHEILGYLLEFWDGDYSHAVAFHNLCTQLIGERLGYVVSLKPRYK